MLLEIVTDEWLAQRMGVKASAPTDACRSVWLFTRSFEDQSNSLKVVRSRHLPPASNRERFVNCDLFCEQSPTTVSDYREPCIFVLYLNRQNRVGRAESEFSMNFVAVLAMLLQADESPTNALSDRTLGVIVGIMFLVGLIWMAKRIVGHKNS